MRASALVMLDIDDFKNVNDVHGHGVGDQVLSELADVAAGTVRATDVLCRIGGEEFAVIVPAGEGTHAVALAERLADRLERADFGAAGQRSPSRSASPTGPEHAMNARELIACAEAAMMTAKARGKNQVVLFDDSATERPDAATVARGRPLDRAPEDAPVPGRQAEPAQRTWREIGDDGRRTSSGC